MKRAASCIISAAVQQRGQPAKTNNDGSRASIVCGRARRPSCLRAPPFLARPGHRGGRQTVSNLANSFAPPATNPSRPDRKHSSLPPARPPHVCLRNNRALSSSPAGWRSRWACIMETDWRGRRATVPSRAGAIVAEASGPAATDSRTTARLPPSLTFARRLETGGGGANMRVRQTIATGRPVWLRRRARPIVLARRRRQAPFLSNRAGGGGGGADGQLEMQTREARKQLGHAARFQRPSSLSFSFSLGGHWHPLIVFGPAPIGQPLANGTLLSRRHLETSETRPSPSALGELLRRPTWKHGCAAATATAPRAQRRLGAPPGRRYCLPLVACNLPAVSPSERANLSMAGPSAAPTSGFGRPRAGPGDTATQPLAHLHALVCLAQRVCCRAKAIIFQLIEGAAGQLACWRGQ